MRNTNARATLLLGCVICAF